MKKYNLVNQKFNNLKVIELSDKKCAKKRYWKCICDCGNYTDIETSKLVSGWTKSCGCLYKDNILGLKSGKLVVIKFDKIQDNRAYWICKCECGNITRLNTNAIKSGHTKSCGCNLNSGKTNCQWKGVGEMSGGYWCGIVKRAKKSNLELNITKEYIWNLFLKQDKKCALSGLDLRFATKQGINDGTASLDRIDSSRGYVENNVQWLHKDVNYMKQDFSDDYFINTCKLISNKFK